MKTNNIAPLNPSNVLDTVAKFFRLMEAAGVSWESFLLPINNKTARKNLAAYLKAGCPKLEGLQLTLPESGYGRARIILGEDFVSPCDVEQARSLTYADTALQHFAETLPSEEVLQWLRDNSFVLVAGTPEAMSTLEIRDLKNNLFYSKTEGWYTESKHRFSRDDKVIAEWLMLRKGIVPKSTSKNYGEQQALLSKLEYVPNVAQVVWAETVYHEVRGKWIFPDVYARTSSVDADGDCVLVGYSADVGVNVARYWDDRRGGDLGVASARKLNLSS